MIVGNKKQFAVEFEKSEVDPRMGHAKLWLEGSFIGAKEDLIFLKGYLISIIDEIINSRAISFPFQSLDTSKLFEQLRIENKQLKYLVSGATFTDDFEIYSFRDSTKIVVVWKLRSEETVFKELKDYGMEIKMASFEQNEIEAIRNIIYKQVD